MLLYAVAVSIAELVFVDAGVDELLVVDDANAVDVL